MQILTGDDILGSAGPKVAVYGLPGSGKSYGITTYTKGNILLFQFEPGIVAAAVKTEARQRLTAVRVSDWDEISGIAGGFEKWCQDRKLPLEDNTLVAWDSETMFAQMVVRAVMKLFPSKMKENLPEKQSYGIIKERIWKIHHALLAIPQFVYCTAQVRSQNVGEGDSEHTILVPSIVGSFREEVGHLFDWFFYARKSMGKYILTTENTNETFSKSRGLTLPREIPFDLDKLVELYQQVKGA